MLPKLNILKYPAAFGICVFIAQRLGIISVCILCQQMFMWDFLLFSIICVCSPFQNVAEIHILVFLFCFLSCHSIFAPRVDTCQVAEPAAISQGHCAAAFGAIVGVPPTSQLVRQSTLRTIRRALRENCTQIVFKFVFKYQGF